MQLCLVHMVRHSLHYVGWKERKTVAADLKKIYRAATEAEAEEALRDFEIKWLQAETSRNPDGEFVIHLIQQGFGLVAV